MKLGEEVEFPPLCVCPQPTLRQQTETAPDGLTVLGYSFYVSYSVCVCVCVCAIECVFPRLSLMEQRLPPAQGPQAENTPPIGPPGTHRHTALASSSSCLHFPPLPSSFSPTLPLSRLSIPPLSLSSFTHSLFLSAATGCFFSLPTKVPKSKMNALCLFFFFFFGFLFFFFLCSPR